MKKILWFASWYPSTNDPYTGDFIARHALATAPFVELDLLHVVKSAIAGTGQEETVEILPVNDSKTGSADRSTNSSTDGSTNGKTKRTATVIYYRVRNHLLPAARRLRSFFTYLKVHRRYLEKYLAEKGKPDLIHVHVAFPAGVAAWRAKKRYGIPYIVSEHWTGIIPEARPNLNDLGIFRRWLWKKVMQEASAASAVSQYLATGMKQQFSLSEVVVIPNVVDGNVFYPDESLKPDARFVHISGFKPQKNLEEIIVAAGLLKKMLPEFSLQFIGGEGDKYYPLIKKLGLENQIHFLGTMPQHELRFHINAGTALILYSLYETFGCVIIEANACGRPVVVSDLPVTREIVTPGRNGLLVPLHNPEQLAAALLSIAKKETRFDGHAIRKYALENYSFDKTGRRFSELYDQLLPRL